MIFYILLLTFISIRISYDKYINDEYKKKNIVKYNIRYSSRITSFTNLLFTIYLALKLFGNLDISENIYNILLPNIIIMSTFFWIFLAPKCNNNQLFNFTNLYLHLFSCLFILLEHFDNPEKFKPDYFSNIVWILFGSILIYSYNCISKKKMYGLLNLKPGKNFTYNYFFLYLVSLICLIYLLDRFRPTAFN